MYRTGTPPAMMGHSIVQRQAHIRTYLEGVLLNGLDRIFEEYFRGEGVPMVDHWLVV